MSAKFELLKKYFDYGLWNKEKLKNAVIKDWISKDEFELITDEEYSS